MTIYGDVWRKVHGTVTGKPDNFSWLIENKLAGSAIPTSNDEVQWAVGQGIKSIITVREEPLDDTWVKMSIIYTYSQTTWEFQNLMILFTP